LRQLPLATATNLRNSLTALGEVMDVEDDLLVLISPVMARHDTS
jgi:hypothetical protein